MVLNTRSLWRRMRSSSSRRISWPLESKLLLRHGLEHPLIVATHAVVILSQNFLAAQGAGLHVLQVLGVHVAGRQPSATKRPATGGFGDCVRGPTQRNPQCSRCSTRKAGSVPR